MANTRVCHFKLVLLGDSAVGKSCLVVRFVRDEFFEFQEPTIGGVCANCTKECKSSYFRFLYVQLLSWHKLYLWTMRPSNLKFGILLDKVRNQNWIDFLFLFTINFFFFFFHRAVQKFSSHVLQRCSCSNSCIWHNEKGGWLDSVCFCHIISLQSLVLISLAWCGNSCASKWSQVSVHQTSLV